MSTHYLDIRLAVDMTDLVAFENYAGAKQLIGASDEDFLMKYSLFLKSKIVSSLADLKNIDFVGGTLVDSESEGKERILQDKPKESNGNNSNELKTNLDSPDDEEVKIPTEREIFEHDFTDTIYALLIGGAVIEEVVVNNKDYLESLGEYRTIVRSDMTDRAVIRYTVEEDKHIREERV